MLKVPSNSFKMRVISGPQITIFDDNFIFCQTNCSSDLLNLGIYLLMVVVECNFLKFYFGFLHSEFSFNKFFINSWMSFVQINHIVEMYSQPARVVTIVENEHTRTKIFDYLSVKFEIAFSNVLNKF